MSRAIVDRLARFDENSDGFAPVWHEMLRDPELRILNGLSMAFVQAIYPDGIDGYSVLATGADPVCCDALVAANSGLVQFDRMLRLENDASCWWLSHGPRADSAPAQGRFRSIGEDPPSPTGKPAIGGLFTCPGSARWPGLWHIYVPVKSVFDAPYVAWRLHTPPDARVLELKSAVDYCELVLRFPAKSISGLTVNWNEASTFFDAIAIGPLALAAADCVGFTYRGEEIAASFWGVPTTLWLKWEFVGTVPEKLSLGRELGSFN